MKWLEDEEFIRGNIPMTKFDIRILTIAMLCIENEDVLLDIGAGTGSISIEASLQGAKQVWGIERKSEGIELIKKNMKKFNVQIQLIKGEAPDCLPQISINKCFIGGSGGKLEEVFEYLEENLLSKGIVCANFVTLKNLNRFIQLLEKYNYIDVEVKLIQSSKVDNIGLLRGNNPIFLVKGVKR